MKVEEYHPTEKRSDRLVLAEVFTGAGCPPCVGADLAFDAAMERYSPKDVAVVMYHEHVPRPDPMTNPDTIGAVEGIRSARRTVVCHRWQNAGRRRRRAR